MRVVLYYVSENFDRRILMKKKHEFKLWNEFKAFINRGSVLDLAVGMIIGSAFTAIVNSLVKGILQPLINMIPLGQDGKSLQVVLRDPVVDSAGTVIKEAVIMDFGAVISAIITFLLTALVLFLVIKAINKAREIGDKEKERFEKLANKMIGKNGEDTAEEATEEVAEVAEEPAPAPVEPAPDKTQELLSAILDELKAQRADKE